MTIMQSKSQALNYLCEQSLTTLVPRASENIFTPNYDRLKTKIGVVHFGPGAFHRAHQAYYFDKLLSINPNYAIAGVSLHSSGVKDNLEPQDFLYAIAQIDKEPSLRIIGAIKEILFAPKESNRIISLLSDENVKIITSTITEKGYYLNSNGALDFSQAEIVHDLESLDKPESIYGYLLAGLKERAKKGIAPFTIIVCDNLSNNGNIFRQALLDFAKQSAPELLDYLSAIECPCTMVDSITPATDDNLRARTQLALGLKDNWPIAREKFTQWVIEDYSKSGEIPWRTIGVEITNDISQYERAKLRILNGAHSSLAYLGILKGYRTVFETLQDNEIRAFITNLIFNEIIPLLDADFSLTEYANAVLKRFENPNIEHQISQIAWDGSKKMPVRIFSSLIEASKNNLPFNCLAASVAYWIGFIAKMAKSGNKITDPIGDKLIEIAKNFNGKEGDIDAFMTHVDIFEPEIKNDIQIINAIKSAYLSAPK